jgi:peptidoglycan/LPS O-acetylase OafA/YrhL
MAYVQSGVLGIEKTIRAKLVESQYRPSGFDYLRILLALGVLIWHSFGIAYGMDFSKNLMINNYIVRSLVIFILPSFFTLSGFLVASSLERSPSVFYFLGLRVIRIVPALAVETTLSAIFIGLLFTDISTTSYLSNPMFFKYFLNIIGLIHYNLPGLFELNPISRTVNGQLWTVPYELKCYIVLAVLSFLGLVSRRKIFFMICILVTIWLVAHEVAHKSVVEAHNDFNLPGGALVVSFLLGVLMYKFSDMLRHSNNIFIIVLASYLLILLGPVWQIVIIPISYMTIYIGLLNFRKSILVRAGDFIYGVYLYHFVIQQTLASFGVSIRHWYFILPLSFLLTGLFAAFSWFLIERPALGWRRFLGSLDDLFSSFLEKYFDRRRPF